MTTRELLEDPSIVPSLVYSRARQAARDATRLFGNQRYDVVDALAEITVQALAGLGLTKYHMAHTEDLLPDWHVNFPSFNLRDPLLSDAFAIAQTIASECDYSLWQKGNLSKLASHQATRAVVVSLFAEGHLLVRYG